MNPLHFTGQTTHYRGKVRDVYYIGENWLVMIASNRISAFDVILPHPIPFKGQVLNQIASHMLNACADICPNWLIESPAPQVSIGKRCEPFKIEMVVRGTLTGHAWRTYNSGKRSLCGAVMPDGLKEHDFFPTPIITPSTKAAEGHDEDISASEIIAQGLATASEWEQLCNYALALFKRGQALAQKQGLILADTKYEFGKINGEITLMDEIHTPDSSRYFILEGFDERQLKGEKQKQLSKEFVREWLIKENFMGQTGQVVPEMSEAWISEISQRYIDLYELLIGEPFKPEPIEESEMVERIETSLSKLAQ
jgi:phosphoribosylaminoimidazole-succinocarboxamide synthase